MANLLTKGISKNAWFSQNQIYSMKIVVKSYICQFTFCQLISHISCSIYTRVLKVGSINHFSQLILQSPLDFSYDV